MIKRTGKNSIKTLIFWLLFTSLVFPASSLFAAKGRVSATFSKHERAALVRLFQDTPFKPSTIQSIFFDTRLKKMPVSVNRNINNKEISRNYDNFLSPYSIHLANQFARKWRTLLKRASLKFGVDREVLVAVLLVETGFGSILGRYPIVSVYASIVSENLKQQRCLLSRLDGCLNEKSRKRLNSKAKWAKKELMALIEIAENSNRSVFHLKGSYAGAFGIPQFLPSSYLKWGFDSDRNGSVNLFLFPDAIYSTANYLKAHGWQKGLQTPANREVVWKYNNSQIYVDTIFKVAQKVKVKPANLATRSVSGGKQITLNLKKQTADNPS